MTSRYKVSWDKVNRWYVIEWRNREANEWQSVGHKNLLESAMEKIANHFTFETNDTNLCVFTTFSIPS